MTPSTFSRCAVVPAVLLALGAGPMRAQPTLLHELASPNESELGFFGISVSGVPDADGDGWGDLLIGACCEASGTSPNGAGRAYVFNGATGTLLHELRSPNEQEDGNFGEAVSGVGDVDGDGYGDLLAGASGEDPDRAYVFSGATGALLHELASPNEEENGAFGDAVSGAEDVDGDGIDDLLVGAFKESPGTSPEDAGRAYVFSGATGAVLHELASPNELDPGFFGISVSGVPDADGDGRGDLLVGALGEERVYAFSGATGALLHTLESPGSPGGHDSDGFGAGVSGVADVDGDGRGDLLVGSAGQRVPPVGEAGSAYVFSGATGAVLHDLVSPNAQLNGRFGSSVSGVEDLDGDGIGDLLVGADGEGYGQAYVFSGVTGILIHELGSPNAEDGGFGRSVSGIPDVDGDGLGDLLVGAWREDPETSPSWAGRAYVFSRDMTVPLLVAAPVAPPVVIPSEGGTFAFTATLTGQSTSPDTWGVWAEGTGQLGEPAFGLGPVLVALEPGQDTTLVLVQEVAADVPAGDYTYTVYVGQYPAPAGSGVSFPITKTEATGVEGEAPSAFALGEPRPNPSSGQSVLTFDLPEVSRIRLSVYDALGREVAVLVNRQLEAGQHEAVLDASHLPSGAYLVRLEAGGEVQTQRVTLVR